MCEARELCTDGTKPDLVEALIQWVGAVMGKRCRSWLIIPLMTARRHRSWVRGTLIDLDGKSTSRQARRVCDRWRGAV